MGWSRRSAPWSAEVGRAAFGNAGVALMLGGDVLARGLALGGVVGAQLFDSFLTFIVQPVDSAHHL
ncbi:hypothetical protein IMZ48_05425 [Candidatus Bathyarchaeota archaeon]|nr:hypothetical protein [Candidatus Bathyarchaeota archaeon]